MSASLFNVTTQDAYTPAAQLLTPAATRLIATVSNNAVRYQLGHGWPAPVWESAERTLLPTIASLERTFDAVRFRSAYPGRPAVISVDAVQS